MTLTNTESADKAIAANSEAIPSPDQHPAIGHLIGDLVHIAEQHIDDILTRLRAEDIGTDTLRISEQIQTWEDTKRNLAPWHWTPYADPPLIGCNGLNGTDIIVIRAIARNHLVDDVMVASFPSETSLEPIPGTGDILSQSSVDRQQASAAQEFVRLHQCLQRQEAEKRERLQTIIVTTVLFVGLTLGFIINENSGHNRSNAADTEQKKSYKDKKRK